MLFMDNKNTTFRPLLNYYQNHQRLLVKDGCLIGVLLMFVSYILIETNMEKIRRKYRRNTDNHRWFSELLNNIQNIIET